MKNRPIRIILIEDHLLVREGIKQLLKSQINFKIVGEAADGNDALKKVEQLKPDIVLLDIALKPINGFKICEIIKTIYPKIKILFVTMFNDVYSIKRAMGSGADGFVDKYSLSSELIKAINLIANGNIYLTDSKPLTGMSELKEGDGLITYRELEVLHYLAKGLTSREIAKALFVASSTVETHRKNIIRKLKVNNTASLIKKAFQLNLIPLYELE